MGGEPYAVEFRLERTNDLGQTESYALGSFHNFTSPVVPDCENCKQQTDNGVKSKAQVPITLPLHGLVRDPSFPEATSLRQDHVSGLLEDRLKITVTKV